MIELKNYGYVEVKIRLDLHESPYNVKQVWEFTNVNVGFTDNVMMVETNNDGDIKGNIFPLSKIKEYKLIKTKDDKKKKRKG